jgi:ribosomal-protein-alanine N-acetyltransferase
VSALVRIADAREAGPAALAALHARALPPGWSEAEIARLMNLPHIIALLALGPEPMGLLLGWTIGEEAEILTLAVAPDVRRRGIGRALVEAGLVAAVARGAQSMFLEVGAGNLAARALYASAGFGEIGRRRGYYAGGEGDGDALVLKLSLEGGEQGPRTPGQRDPGAPMSG